MPSVDDVRAAAARIAPFAHRTPVLTSRSLDEWLGCKDTPAILKGQFETFKVFA